MKIVLFFSLLLMSTASLAERDTFESLYGDTKTESCKNAKDQARRWVDSKMRVAGVKIRSGQEYYGNCDCSEKTSGIAKSWVCVVEASVPDL